MSEVNKIPKNEAVAYLEKNRSRESEKELARILISLIENDLVDAVYQNGQIAYQAKGDHFTAFVNIWSDESEQEIKTMIPKMMKTIKKYKEKRETPFKMGMVSEPLIEALKSFSNRDLCNIKSIQPTASLEKYDKNGRLKELILKIGEYFSVLSEQESRDSKTKINEVIMDIKRSLEEEERKIVESEREINQFIELAEKFQNRSISEVKRILSETRKQLEEKKTKEKSSSQAT